MNALNRFAVAFTFPALALTLAAKPAAALVIGPDFASSYSLVDLGAVSGLPAPAGGLTFLNSNTLLIGGAANQSAGAIYSVPVTRDPGGAITGLGTATLYATAPNIDGGLTFGPGGVLFFTGYSNNTIGQIKPASTVPDRITTVTGNGINSSVGSLVFVPAGYNGAGQLKVLSYNANTWETLPYSLASDSSGTYDFGSSFGEVQLSGGLEGAVYVPMGSPLFANQSVLVSEYGAGRVVAYETDAQGDPVASTLRVLVGGLSGAEGAAIDPVTGDFMFSTFGGGNKVVRVTGFAAPPPPIPEPGSYAMLGVGLAFLSLVMSRRRGA
jgi:hypothetical protein